ncbi:MAG: hypothetical protein KL863_26285 [Rhizobium sp.]|nr:hypothetical protein [Rhizobium sp.]
MAGRKKATRPSAIRHTTAEKPQAGSMLGEFTSQSAMMPGMIAQDPEKAARTT